MSRQQIINEIKELIGNGEKPRLVAVVWPDHTVKCNNGVEKKNNNREAAMKYLEHLKFRYTVLAIDVVYSGHPIARSESEIDLT